MMGILDRLRPRGEAPQTYTFDLPFATSSNTADSSEKANESSMLYGTLTISTTPAATAIGQTPVPKTPQRASLLKRRSRSTTASNAAAASPSTAMDVNLGIHAQLNAASSPTKSNGGGGGGAGDKTRSFASSSSLSSRFTSDSRRHLPVSPSLKSDVPDFPARSDSLQGLCITTNGNEIVGAVGYPQPGDSQDAASTSMVNRNGSRAYSSLRAAKATASGGSEHDNVQTSSTALGSVRSTRSVASACDGWDEDHPTQMSKRKWKSTLLKSKRPQTADAARGHSVSSTSKPHPRRSIDGVRQSSKADQESTGDANTHARHDHSGTSPEKTNSPEVSYAAVKVVMPSISANSNTSNAQSVAGKPSRSRSGTISASTYILRQFAASNAQQPSTTSSAPKTQETDVEKMLRSDSRASTSLHQAVDRLLDVDGECFDGRALIRIIMDTVKMLAEMATRPPNNTKNVGKKTRITLARPHTSSGAPLTITTTTTTTTSTLWEIATCQMESAVMSRLDAVTVSFASRQSLVDRAFELDLAFEQARDLLGLDACSRRVTSALSALIEARGKLFAGDDVHVYSSSPHRRERVASHSVVLRPAPRRGRSRCKVAERAEQVDCDFSSAASSPSSGRRSPYAASQNRPFRTPTLVQPDERFPSLQQTKGDDETNEEHDANTAYRPSTLSVISIQPLTPLTPSTDLFSSQSSALASAPSSPLTEISSNNSSRSSRCQVLAPDAFSTASMMRRRQKRPSYRDADNLSFTHVQMPAPRMTANC